MIVCKCLACFYWCFLMEAISSHEPDINVQFPPSAGELDCLLWFEMDACLVFVFFLHSETQIFIRAGCCSALVMSDPIWAPLLFDVREVCSLPALIFSLKREMQQLVEILHRYSGKITVWLTGCVNLIGIIAILPACRLSLSLIPVWNCPLDFARVLSHRNRSACWFLHQFAITTSRMPRHERALALCICSVSGDIRVFIRSWNLKSAAVWLPAACKVLYKAEAYETSLLPSLWYSSGATEGCLTSYFLREFYFIVENASARP